jgi:transposase
MRRLRPDLRESREPLEPTYSVGEVAEHFGCGIVQVYRLIGYGRKYRSRLHPTRGGLWPTFKVSHKCRRIPLSAIERHKRRMAQLEGSVVVDVQEDET